MKFLLTFTVVLSSVCLFGQSSNVFLDRSYWKNQPTIEQVKADIASGNDASEFNNHKFDAVTWAILEKVPNELVWFLLDQKGNDVNKRSHDGRTPIFWAAYKGNLDLMKSLVENGAKTDLIDHHGYSLVNFAATTGQVDPALYDFCITHGAEMSSEFNKDKATPLLLILPHLTSLDMISYFTSKELSLDQLDKNGDNAFSYAAKSGNQLVMDFLLEKGISPIANNSSAVLFASKGMRSKKNGIETFRYLQKHGVSMDATDDDGRNALHFLASNCKDSSVFNFFLNHGMSLNEEDSDGNTPFWNAFERNSPEMISFLLSKQSVETKTNAEGENIIHRAVKRGNPDVLRLAIQTEKEINALSEVGLAPLHIAAMQAKDFELIEILLKSGASTKTKTPFGEKALDLAMENKWLEDKRQLKKKLK